MASLNKQAKFSAAPLGIDMPRSTFDRSFNYKATANAGLLNCFMVDEIYPGDTVDLRSTILTRMTTPLFPVLDSCFVESAVFFVPNRLVWDHWKQFCGENDTTQWVESDEHLVPQQPVANAGTNQFGRPSRTVGDLSHQMGIPYDLPANAKVNGLYHRAYRLIWNDWFRDQNLQAPTPLFKGDNDNPSFYNELLPVARVHDYFGSCLPAPQHGEAARIALTGLAPVVATGESYYNLNPNQYPVAFATEDGQYEDTANIAASGGWLFSAVSPSTISPGEGLFFDNVKADLSNVGVDVATLRLAVQTQRILEKLNLGSRYVEFVRNFFGVTSPDGRQQRPELLAHSKQLLNMHDVTQTAPSDGTNTPLGTIGGYSKTFDPKCAFTHSFTEHGMLIGLYWFRHNRTYSQGINKLWRRRRFEDYYVPQLAHINDQPVYVSELYNSHDFGPNQMEEQIFGYQEPWAELRYKPSVSAGLLDPACSDLGKVWTYTDLYDAIPVLSSTWIEEGSAEIARTLAVTDEDQFIVDVNVSFKHTRCLPVYSIPGLVDHF